MFKHADVTQSARLLYKLEHFQRQAHNTGRAATLETKNQRLFFNRTHENDHAAYGTSRHILFLLFKLNCHCSLRIWIQDIAPPTLSLI